MTRAIPLEGGYDHGPLFEIRKRRGTIHRNAWIHGARRRRTEREQTPVWVDRDAIAALYKEARRLTRETGEQYVVDHIVPLRGKTVCGLHWHGNMRIMHWRENAQKGALEWPDMPFEQLVIIFLMKVLAPEIISGLLFFHRQRSNEGERR